MTINVQFSPLSHNITHTLHVYSLHLLEELSIVLFIAVLFLRPVNKFQFLCNVSSGVTYFTLRMI